MILIFYHASYYFFSINLVKKIENYIILQIEGVVTHMTPSSLGQKNRLDPLFDLVCIP